jgi:hypothetical protein
MSTKLPLAPEADSIAAAEPAFNEAIVETVPVLLAEPVEALVDDPLELLAVLDEVRVGAVAEFEAVLVGWKVSCPTAKPMFDA